MEENTDKSVADQSEAENSENSDSKGSSPNLLEADEAEMVNLTNPLLNLNEEAAKELLNVRINSTFNCHHSLQRCR